MNCKKFKLIMLMAMLTILFQITKFIDFRHDYLKKNVQRYIECFFKWTCKFLKAFTSIVLLYSLVSYYLVLYQKYGF